MIKWLRGNKDRDTKISAEYSDDLSAARTALHDHRALGLCCLEVSADKQVQIIGDGIGLFDERSLPTRLDALSDSLSGGEDLTSAIAKSLEGDPEEADFGAPSPPIKLAKSAQSKEWWVKIVPVLRSDTDHDPSAARRLFLQDVSAEQEVKAGLEKRVAFVNRALDRAPFGLVVLDQKGIVRDANTAFLRLVDNPALVGKPLIDLFLAEDQSDFDRLLETMSAQGDTPTSGPVDLRLDVGEGDRVVTVFGNRTHVEQIDEPGVLLHAVDATERKRLETQFAQSQKMQAVGQLAGGIAHDFNNVLTAIIGFCDLLLQRHQPGDPSFADVMQIQQNANRAAGLTRQLLAFSRQQTIRSRIVDVTDTLAELSNLLRRLLGESVDLSMLHGQDLWVIRGDRGQLEQIVINLAVNARDAMEKGGRLIIQTDNFSSERPYQMRDSVMPAGDYVMLCVSDTGMGMSEEVLSRLFEPFFTTKEVGRGTGLGLAMVYGSVTQMEGHIVAHSDGPGKGASFTLYLPRAIETDRDRANKPAPGDSNNSDAGSDDTGGESILLVEDEDAVRLFSARALRSKGYIVTEARTGEIAIGILADQSFDLLITDMVMPKVDGAALIRKAREAAPMLPVICISGYTRESVAKEVAELPGVSFLSKPFSLKQLTGKVRSVLSQNKAQI